MSDDIPAETTGSLFDEYALGAAWDEMLAEPGAPAHAVQARSSTPCAR